MKGREDNWGQRSARCQAERRSGAALHSPKAQSLRSFFCIQASKLSVKYSCDNAGGSEQRRLANLSSTTRWIFRGRKGKKTKDSGNKIQPFFPTACRPHMQLCEHRISPNVVYHQPTTWWQGNNRLVLYDMHTHTHNCCSHARYCHSSRTRGVFECRPVLLPQTHMPNDDQRFDTASRNLWPLACAARNLFLLPDIESFSMS
jgi:hypothetical protein